MKKVFLLITLSLTILACKKDPTTTTSLKETEKDSIEVANLNLGYKIGDIASDFSLKNIDNKMVSLKDFTNAKGFIVIFTCNHCPYAKAYEDRIINLHKRFEPLGYPVIAINPNDPELQPEDSFEKMKIRAQEKEFPFVYLLDEKQEVYPKFGATKTPHVFILNKENAINIVKYIGTIDNNYENADNVSQRFVEDAIFALLENRDLTTTNTVAVGCSIKLKK